LGIEEGDGNDNSQINKLVTEYYHQAWQILKTELKIEEHHSYNTLAVPVLVYSFGIVNW
jgi:hypothetical protein